MATPSEGDGTRSPRDPRWRSVVPLMFGLGLGLLACLFVRGVELAVPLVSSGSGWRPLTTTWAAELFLSLIVGLALRSASRMNLRLAALVFLLEPIWILIFIVDSPRPFVSWLIYLALVLARALGLYLPRALLRPAVKA